MTQKRRLYREGFIRAVLNGKTHNKFDAMNYDQLPHFGTHEINGDPIPNEQLDGVIEQLSFGWWDTHHQDGGTYQLPCEEN